MKGVVLGDQVYPLARPDGKDSGGLRPGPKEHHKYHSDDQNLVGNLNLEALWPARPSLMLGPLSTVTCCLFSS